MPPTLVAAAVGVLLAVALLGPAFDRRSVAVVVAVAAVPDLDLVFVLVGPGGPNATFHTVFLPLLAAAALYCDTRIRGASRLADRYGPYGVRVAWVAVAALAVAGIGVDAFSSEGVALLYPLSDRYYAIVGGFLLSTQDGVVQTYVTVADGWVEVSSPGTLDTHTIPSPLAPGDDRRLRIVETGEQAVLVATALVSLPAKWLVERRDRSRRARS
ncbi:YdjM family protein [Natronomonas moolapensis 8.8.11]|uniref:YdjM family protein n=2 Tax=Natronomonas moolapensis TaxID=416273 RepID=M1XSA4_NATM8|nr:YdjM family protein [Natronomonas moolapensis 8.8.11]